ncbi:MAG: transcriptional activator RfaH [Pseudomonadota bacterium]
MMASSPHWYAVQTKAHAEIKASEHLRRQGFQVYLPRYLKRRRHARVSETVIAPLFPRYLFVMIDIAAQRWRSIQSTIGVSRLVYQGEYPAVVPDCVLQQLKEREDARGIIQVDRSPAFAPGDKIRVVDGAFADNIGLFDRMTDGERVAVLLELLGRKVRVVMDLDLVTAA